jgi:large subunit ribosomal protein L18
MEDINKIKRKRKARRHVRVRAKIKGTAQVPRLSVFRSNKHIYLQLIDDEKGKTIASVGDFKIKILKKGKAETTKIKLAFEAGKALAELAKKKKIKTAVFDRGGFVYHGRIKAAAEGAREGGLEF